MLSVKGMPGKIEQFITWLAQNGGILSLETRISGFNGAKTKCRKESLRIDVSRNTRFHAHEYTAARKIEGAAEVNSRISSRS